MACQDDREGQSENGCHQAARTPPPPSHGPADRRTHGSQQQRGKEHETQQWHRSGLGGRGHGDDPERGTCRDGQPEPAVSGRGDKKRSHDHRDKCPAALGGDQAAQAQAHGPT